MRAQWNLVGAGLGFGVVMFLHACSDPITIAETDVEATPDGGIDATPLDARPPDVPMPPVCEAGGECVPGQTRTVACGLCGKRTDTCSSTCRFETGTCTGEGVCQPDTIEGTPSGCSLGSKERACSATCSWGAWSACGTSGGARPMAKWPGFPESPWQCVWVKDHAACYFAFFDSTLHRQIGIYTPGTNTWEMSPDLDDGLGSELIAVGDRLALLAEGGTVPKVWLYDRAAKTFEPPIESPLSPRAGTVTVYVPATNELVVLSGREPDGPLLTDGASFSPVTKTWSSVFSTTGAETIPSFDSFNGRAFATGSRIATVLRTNDYVTDAIGIYDVAAKSWSLTPYTPSGLAGATLLSLYGTNGLLFATGAPPLSTFDLTVKALTPFSPPASVGLPAGTGFSTTNQTGLVTMLGASLYGFGHRKGFRLDLATQAWTSFDAPAEYDFTYADGRPRVFVGTGTEFLFFGTDQRGTFIYRP